MSVSSKIRLVSSHLTLIGLRNSARGWSREVYRSLLLVASLGLQISTSLEAADKDRQTSANFGKLTGIYEPSGVQQLSDGRFLIVEDEALTPFALLAFDPDGEPTVRPLRLPPRLAMRLQLNDLEGLAPGENGYIYAITSHSLKRSGKRDPSRQRLVQLKIDGDRLNQLAVSGSLREQIVARLNALVSPNQSSSVGGYLGLNIEALAFDPAASRLLIGLRSPVVEGNAVILSIRDPAAFFKAGTTPTVEPSPWLLDLDGGGIRGLAYDPSLQGLLVLSREETKSGKPFKLWLWRGDQEIPPCRMRLGSAADLEAAEGVTPARIGDSDQILILRDDGNAGQRKAAHYLRLGYPDLPIQACGDPSP